LSFLASYQEKLYLYQALRPCFVLATTPENAGVGGAPRSVHVCAAQQPRVV
jgi:hypothetical protein